MTDEFSRIARIKQRLSIDSDQIEIGIGDDAAVLTPSDAAQVLSVDVQVEEVHFRREYLSVDDIGYRSLVAALSDLAAMGAQPRAALLSLILPIGFTDDQLFALVDGIAEAANQYRTPVVGGNLSSGRQLSITTTVVGQVGERVLTRYGAKPGDTIYLTGAVGHAALGLKCLQSGNEAKGMAFVRRWRRPTALLAQGQRLVGSATAAIDISDGLLQDLSHICQASKLNAEIEIENLPLEADYRRLAVELGCDPIELAITGGEDYELVFTAPQDALVDAPYIPIGRTLEGTGEIEVRDSEGKSIGYKKRGYRHWDADDAGTG
jgi:thiamine-monophosphate kinase